MSFSPIFPQNPRDQIPTTTTQFDPQSNSSWAFVLNYKYGDGKAIADTLSRAVFFDAVVNHSYDLKSEVTSYAVEGGAVISDHVQDKNDNYFITGIISNTPLENYNNNAIPVADGSSRVKLAVETLRQIKEARQPVTLINEYEILENVVLTQITFEQTPETAEAIAFKLSYEKVRLASAMQTYANVSSGSGGNGANAVGKNTANTTSDLSNSGGTAKKSLTFAEQDAVATQHPWVNYDTKEKQAINDANQIRFPQRPFGV